MVNALWFGTFIMSILLLLFSIFQKIQHPFRKLLRWYSLLFFACTIGLTAISYEEYKGKLAATFNHWFSLNSESVAATGTMLEEGTSFVPLIDEYILKESVHIHVPTTHQYPELPRGCEVTSLSMLLQHHDIQVDKMTLADQIHKDPTPYQEKGNSVHFGNPNDGFVGDMYSLSNPGYGVYHGPVASLAAKHVGAERVNDFTGQPFYKIIEELHEGRPVWVITNTTYNKLPDHYFTTWQTKAGPIDITRKEHSVVITGYDEQHIYFNDPLSGQNKKAPINEFHAAWVQMGKQAISIK
ncbi:C39 family peptidase [Pontibacillus salicampi]|uniref:C39 family peptidase n=1 Tax=Pontibacillus salicampi TaxID=1449801 RepID=A0ABV6LNI4_9BACI